MANDVASMKCPYCGGTMATENVPQYNRFFGIILIVVGLLGAPLLLGFLGQPLAIILVIIGLYMISASKEAWVCDNCHGAFERVAAKSIKE